MPFVLFGDAFTSAVAYCGGTASRFCLIFSTYDLFKEWDGSSFRRSSLKSLGLVYQLGHHGRPCHFPKPPRALTVVDNNSVHEICVRECGCQFRAGNPPSRAEQLLQNGWYPATTTDPDSCATLRALELFRAQNVAGNLSGDSFVSALVALTDPTNQTWVAVSLLSFLCSHFLTIFNRIDIRLSCGCLVSTIC